MEAVVQPDVNGPLSVAVPAATTTWERFLGVIAAGAAALLPIAISSATESQTFAPKYALLLILAAVGVVPLVRLSVSSRYVWQARVALAFVAVAALSAALSPSKLVGFFGLYLWGEGFIFLLALMSAWAVGVSLTPTTRPWLVTGLIVGTTVNAVAAVVQTAFHLNTQIADLSGFGLFNGTQADGMMGNPIHLEAILLGGLALILGRTCRQRWPSSLWNALLVALFAAALECSSERLGIVLLLVLFGYAVFAYRRHALTYVVSGAVGFGIAFLAGAGASLSQRVAASTASTTYGLRLHAATEGALATLKHRPLFGFGPGQVRNALTLYESRSFARSLGPGRYFTDLHDLPANILVMTGLVGFVLFCLFFLGSSWRVKGALAGYAAFVLLVELVEPMNVAVTPLAFLALGAALAESRGEAWAPEELGVRTRRRLVGIAAALGAVALIPAALLVVGDTIEHTAIRQFSLADANRANSLLPIWPSTANAVAQIYAYQSVVDPAQQRVNLVQSRHWVAIGAARDPSDVNSWVLLATADLSIGDLRAARADAAHALAENPLGISSLSAVGGVAGASGDWARAVSAYAEAASIAPTDASVKAGLRAARARNARYFASLISQ